METIAAAAALARKDLVSWFRTPVHVMASFVPTLIIMLLLGLILSGTETMPVAVVMDAPDDPLSQQFVETVQEIETAYYPWFEVVTEERQAAEELFKANRVLGVIEVPDITAKLEAGESAVVRLKVSNLNDDITKNFRQRVQEACLVFNEEVSGEAAVLVAAPVVADFHTFLPQDLPPLAFFGAGIVALAIVMGGINNAALLVAREFEEKTYRELVLGPSTVSIILGKWGSAVVQTLISVGLVWGLATAYCGFIPQGSVLPLLLLVVVGSVAFAGLGTLLALYFKQVIPAAIAGILFSIVGWWFGGVIWADIWPTVLQGVIAVFPSTYLMRAFTRGALLDVYTTYWLDVGILVAFGLITGVLAYVLLRRKMAV